MGTFVPGKPLRPELTADEKKDLGAVLDRWRTDAALLSRYGHVEQAETILAVCQTVEHAARDWLVFLSEKDAILKSGRSAEWLRARFPSWEQAGHARGGRSDREYRACVVPQREPDHR